MKKFFKNIIESIVEARKIQAAYQTAEYLKRSNRDFDNISISDLVNRILDENNPTHLDGTPIKRKEV